MKQGLGISSVLESCLRTAIAFFVVSTITFAEHDPSPPETTKGPAPTGPAEIHRPAPPAGGQPRAWPAGAVPAPVGPPRVECNRFLNDLDVNEALRAFRVLADHWDIFDDADRLFARHRDGTRRAVNDFVSVDLRKRPPVREVAASSTSALDSTLASLYIVTVGIYNGGSVASAAREERPTIDRKVALVDLEAVSNHVLRSYPAGVSFGPPTSYLIRNFRRFDLDRDNILSFAEMVSLTAKASEHRNRCRTGAARVDNDMLRECEKRLAEFHRANDLEETIVQSFRHRTGAERESVGNLMLGMMAQTSVARASLAEMHGQCGLTTQDPPSVFAEDPPPMGCPSKRVLDGAGRVEHASTACNGDNCFSCEVEILGKKVGQVCADKESAKLALLALCDYAQENLSECLRAIEGPNACRPSAFKYAVRGCTGMIAESRSRTEDAATSLGIAPFVPFTAGQGGMLNLGSHTTTLSMTLGSGLSFIRGENTKRACQLENGVSFAHADAEPMCTWNIERLRAVQYSAGVDLMGSGFMDTQTDSVRASREDEVSLSNPGGSTPEKLELACHIWQSRQNPHIAAGLEAMIARYTRNPAGPDIVENPKMSIPSKADPPPPELNFNFNQKQLPPDPRDRTNRLGDADRIRRW